MNYKEKTLEVITIWNNLLTKEEQSIRIMIEDSYDIDTEVMKVKLFALVDGDKTQVVNYEPVWKDNKPKVELAWKELYTTLVFHGLTHFLNAK